MAGFVEELDPINELADTSPGFVWRLQTEEGNATSIDAFDDPLLLVNLSVWEDVASLKEFTYRSRHREPLRKRGKWFERMQEPHAVLWWIGDDHIPDVAEAKERLAYLREHGPTERAFTLNHPKQAPRPDPPNQEPSRQ